LTPLPILVRPNPPKLVTVAIAVLLLVVGTSLTVFPIGFVNEALAMLQTTFGTSVEPSTQLGWILMLAGDALLIVGSLLPGI
jgi:hypothetical protein